MRLIHNLAPADELKWLMYQQVRLSRQIGSVPPLDRVPLGNQDLHQAYRQLQVRQATLMAALGAWERGREPLHRVYTWPSLDPAGRDV